ncbi:retrovirus-related Pol polyprotein from transposon opus [Nephila pilipes]|uniref:RNA-directed DNA polymerase n=1 Tax=Nephila pilipes TaxID=299642 RepID=A0A8X6P8A7_NEPPI|nr:retrovirus-related Pol polyprotein from transposon opus [Nephila pilipes]
MVSETTWFKSIILDVNHKCFDVNFKLDTSAEVNILPLYILNKFKVKPKLSETNLSLTTYGLKSCKELQLIEIIDAIECSVISKNELINQYRDVFTGIGEFPSEPYHITLKDNSVPVIHPPRRVPQALQPKLKSTSNNLEKEGIVSKVNKPTDWVQSLVIVEKPNGNLRSCLDPRDLNKVIKREHYQIPCTDDIISRLEGKKIFSVVGLKDGFWHVPLDEVSSEICTFNTPYGRYKFNKLIFGIVSAPEVFKKRNQKLFGDIEGVEIYFDDIIVAGYDEDSHDAIMAKVLERARSLNIKFNPDKLQYRVSEVKYVGQIISKSVTAPLREIIHENVEFNWGKEQELSLVSIKEAKAPILKVFSASDEIIIQCNSSKDGLGSCLIQKGQPVSFVSRSLTNTEKNYAQIEKELLAIVFSFEKYHNFVYGRKVAIQSDHKPLMAIVKKPMQKISSRMQRMILKLLKYDFEINYVPGNQMFLADTLSRAFPVNETVRDDPEMLNIVHTVSKHLPMSEKRQEQFKKETELDPELKIVVKYIKEGWPKSYKSVDNSVKTYYKIKNNLYIQEGLLFSNEKLIVPYSLRKDMLKLIHKAHFGIEKCKKRAREIMYWPGMNSDIETVVSECVICEKFKKANSKELLKPHTVTTQAVT